MPTDTLVETLDTHTAGEPTRIVTSGFDRSTIRGGSVAAQRDRFADALDWLRELLLCEPRGHDDMFGAVPVEPAADNADLGLFFMDSRGYLDMCGHGTIGAVTALIETGQLSPAETVVVETPAGLVETRPTVSDGRVGDVTVRNVESFVCDTVSVSLDNLGGGVTSLDAADPTDDSLSVPVDIVSAGNVFAMVEADAVGLSVGTASVDAFVEYGRAIRRAVNERFDVVDPFTDEARAVSIVEFYEHGAEADRNVVVFGDGQVDRSPCGTGTCAKMMLLHREGDLGVDEPYRYESVIGTRFTGRLVDIERRNGIDVGTPEVTGSAYITGRHTFMRDERDDLGGFSLRS